MRAADRDAGDLARAVALATVGEEEFATLEEEAAFSDLLQRLREEEGYREAAREYGRGANFRRDVVRTLEKEMDVREKALRGARGRWSTVLRLYEVRIRQAPTESVRARLQAHLDQLTELADR